MRYLRGVVPVGVGGLFLVALIFGSSPVAWSGADGPAHPSSLPGISQLPGTEGCITSDGSERPGGPPGVCATGAALGRPSGMAASPDGGFMYVTSGGRTAEADPGPVRGGGIATFRRNAVTGALFQLPGPAGCLTATGGDALQPGAACAAKPGLEAAGQPIVSGDGRNVYAVGQTLRVTNFPYRGTREGGEVIIHAFARDPVTGRIESLPGRDGCVSASGRSPAGPCVRAPILEGGASLTLDRGGRTLYTSGYLGYVRTRRHLGPDDPGPLTRGGIGVLRRDPRTGALAPLPGRQGCVTSDGRMRSGGAKVCGAVSMLGEVDDVAVAPEGRTVYVATSESDPQGFAGGGGILTLARSHTGALSRLPGRAGCLFDRGVRRRRFARLCRPLRSRYLPPRLAFIDNRRLLVRGSHLMEFLRGRRGRLTLHRDYGRLPRVWFGQVSADGRLIYYLYGDANFGEVLTFERSDRPPTYRRRPTPTGCIVEGSAPDNRHPGPPPSPPCATGRALLHSGTVMLSPDERALYVGGDSGLAIFSISG